MGLVLGQAQQAEDLRVPLGDGGVRLVHDHERGLPQPRVLVGAQAPLQLRVGGDHQMGMIHDVADLVAAPQSADGQRPLGTDLVPDELPTLHGLFAQFLGLGDPQQGTLEVADPLHPADHGLGGDPRLAGTGGQGQHAALRGQPVEQGGDVPDQLLLVAVEPGEIPGPLDRLEGRGRGSPGTGERHGQPQVGHERDGSRRTPVRHRGAREASLNVPGMLLEHPVAVRVERHLRDTAPGRLRTPSGLQLGIHQPFGQSRPERLRADQQLEFGHDVLGVAHGLLCRLQSAVLGHAVLVLQHRAAAGRAQTETEFAVDQPQHGFRLSRHADLDRAVLAHGVQGRGLRTVGGTRDLLQLGAPLHHAVPVAAVETLAQGREQLDEGHGVALGYLAGLPTDHVGVAEHAPLLDHQLGVVRGRHEQGGELFGAQGPVFGGADGEGDLVVGAGAPCVTDSAAGQRVRGKSAPNRVSIT